MESTLGQPLLCNMLLNLKNVFSFVAGGSGESRTGVTPVFPNRAEPYLQWSGWVRLKSEISVVSVSGGWRRTVLGLYQWRLYMAGGDMWEDILATGHPGRFLFLEIGGSDR